ncbi:MAG: hypothetical protein ACFCUN_10225 [Hyphomicrobiaceae bacterium]
MTAYGRRASALFNIGMLAIFTLASAAIVVMPTSAEAQAAQSRSAAAKARASKRAAARELDVNKVAVRVARPELAGAFKFDGYPLWAAEAFEPRRNGR